MGNTATNVTTGKPKPAGGIWRAPIGTTLPTDATTALAEAFKSVGYVSEDGVKYKLDTKSENVKAWGGDVVMSYMTERTETFEFSLIETLNPDSYEIIYGETNVTGTLDTGITVRSNATELEESIYVIEMFMRKGAYKRIVIPNGKVTEIGEVTYADNEIVAFPLTITAITGSDGDAHKEYIKRPATT